MYAAYADVCATWANYENMEVEQGKEAALPPLPNL